MSALSFLASLADALLDALAPLRDALASPAALAALIQREGWRPPADDAGLAALGAALALSGDVEQVAATLADVADGSPSLDELGAALDAASKLLNDLRALDRPPGDALPDPLDRDDFWSSFPLDLAEDLVSAYVERAHPTLFAPLHLFGILDETPIQPAADDPARLPYLKRQIRWDRLPTLVTDPAALPRDVYGWGGGFDHGKLLVRLERALAAFGLLVGRHAPVGELARRYYPGDPPADLRLLQTTLLREQRKDGGVELGLLALPIPPSSGGAPDGLFVGPYVFGAAGTDILLDGPFSLHLSGGLESAGIVGIELRPGDMSPRLDGAAATLDLVMALVGKPAQPWRLIGDANGTRLECGDATLALELAGAIDDPELKLRLHSDSLRMVIDLSDSDGFLQDLLGDKPQTVQAAGSLVWSSKHGLSFEGQVGLKLTLPIHQSFGPAQIDQLTIAITAGSGGVQLALGVTGGGKLGPITASVQDIGVALALKPAPDPARGTFGSLDLDFDFKPPTGAGLAIDAPGVSGGGFLLFDREKGQYGGVVLLSIEGRVTVKGIGLIDTRLPDGSPGYSLLVIITAEDFKPIPLPLGFSLTGIGGLLAFNRTFDEAALRAGLKNHTLDSILFPRDPVRNAPQILSNIGQVFPPAAGHYLFGPMAQIAWGAPPLITADIALALEFGARLRLLILAQIVSILPTRDHDLLRLQMDAVGVIDFDQGTAALDATLHDSRLLKKFVLTGDMALRLAWKGSRNFALAVGGLHPAFNPPANFPKLDRIAINLSSGDNPRIRCEAYFALTANTQQFGARAELYAAAAGFSIQGEIGYDVLLQVDPFAFVADFYAQLQLKHGSTSLFKVKVEGELSGPHPLHIKAKATFEILWWDVSIDVDKTLAEGEAPPQLAPVDVLPLLHAALSDPANWLAQIPAGQRPIVTLRAGAGGAGGVAMHPLGSLTVKQSVVPLGLEIARFGQSVPAGARLFSITSASLGDPSQSGQPVKDFFAPAQFLDMSDDEKLSRPSFEQMTAGVSFGSGDFAFTDDGDDWLEVSSIEFDTTIIDQQAGTSRPSGTSDGYRLSIEQLGIQARFGAAGASDLRRSGDARYRTTVGKYRVVKEGWSIVAATDLAVQAAPGLPAGAPASYSEAAQALRKLEQSDPAKAGALTILRLSEIAH